jgi:hypothetical protein
MAIPKKIAPATLVSQGKERAGHHHLLDLNKMECYFSQRKI